LPEPAEARFVEKHAHCSYCGAAFAPDQSWPRRCAGCGNYTYRNPIPVAVCLLPVDGGLLCIRRAIPPAVGELALPGGFVDFGETWQEAAARELWEETGVRIDPAEVRHFRTLSSSLGDGVLLIFGVARERKSEELTPFAPKDRDASEMLIIAGKQRMAFPLHTQAVEAFFDERTGGPS
jgi:ADP-ribose pyrophosphatase YjhB (NUDIX family)